MWFIRSLSSNKQTNDYKNHVAKMETKRLIFNFPKTFNFFYSSRYREIEKKLEWALTKNFSWQFVKISII
jgi:hypothetical protein